MVDHALKASNSIKNWSTTGVGVLGWFDFMIHLLKLTLISAEWEGVGRSQTQTRQIMRSRRRFAFLIKHLHAIYDLPIFKACSVFKDKHFLKIWFWEGFVLIYPSFEGYCLEIYLPYISTEILLLLKKGIAL